MKSHLLFLSFTMVIFLHLSFTESAYADDKIEVSGQVKDKNSAVSLEFCSIRVYTNSDSLILGTITNDKGFFTFLINKGEYKFVIDFLGYQTDTAKVSVQPKSSFLGIFELAPSNLEIGETVVKGTTKETMLDKEVMLVTSQLRTGASNTDDVLNKVKGVTLDRYNNSIKVDGNDNIVILVNGLEKDQSYIRNLAPGKLQKIEIIRDPSGRYALEGYSAVINIILKKDYKGTEFFVNNQVLIDSDAADFSNFVATNDFSATYNYTYNQINLYVKAQNNYSNLSLPFYMEKAYNNDFNIINRPANNDPNNLDLFNFKNDYTLGLDYYLNPKHTLSYEGSYSHMPFDPNITNQRYTVDHIFQSNIIDSYSSSFENINNESGFSNSVYYIGILNNKNRLNANFLQSNEDYDYTNKYNENSILQSFEQGVNAKLYTKLYVELDHEMNEKSSLQIGYGNTYKNLENSFINELNESAINDLNNTNEFKHTDLRHKVYSYYSWNASKQLGLKIGGAIEKSTPEVNGKSRDYIIYLPHMDIKYKPIEHLSAKLKYRSSSSYPTINQANPFTNVIDQQTISTGNPYLDPAVTHKVSLRFDVLSGLASFEPYYHFSNNYISAVGKLRADNIFEYSFDNIGEYTHQGIKGNLTIPFGKSIFLQSSVDFYKSEILYDGITNNLKDFSMEEQLLYVNNKYGSVGGLIYQKNNNYHITAQGWETNNNDFWLLFIQQPLFKKQLNILCGYMMPIDYGINFDQGNYIETAQYNEKQYADLNLIKNIFIVQISYRFNKGKSIKTTEKEIEREIEKTSKGLF